MIRVLTSFLLSALPVVLLSAATIAQERPPTLVVTEQVQQMDFRDQITLVGRTEAQVASRIVAEVSGQVQSIEASEGIWVKAGWPLATIDPDRITFSLQAREAEAAQARHQADLAGINLERAGELFSQKLISQSTFDSVTAWVGVSRERYNQLEAEREQLALDLRNCVISAPFSGYTGRKLVDVGEWVSPGSPVFEMVDVSHVRVIVDLPERYFGHVHPGSRVPIAVSNYDSEELTGSVTGIAAKAYEETHTFPVFIDVPNKEGRLAGGMLVRATLSLDEQFSSLAVSKDAIVRQGIQTMVYTVVDGKANPIPVVTSSVQGTMVAVQADGLAEGMPVVIRGNERIFPGSPVMTADEKQKTE
jgi:RND family efflux transporter MFP subunit